jgi:hypothetical protein
LDHRLRKAETTCLYQETTSSGLRKRIGTQGDDASGWLQGRERDLEDLLS